ncbi:hypothetical protein BDN70DRAFT_882155 [Pholiota conissans]|uniref:C2H2-type domain-containing protein n=1 Tax=Pholiota conissans TaxID=109636 RepID=A0A9P5YWX0_9AGAR|nr:hypothetical protein BDN70DRAFT_882155 [Pholiota conissans]
MTFPETSDTEMAFHGNYESISHDGRSDDPLCPTQYQYSPVVPPDAPYVLSTVANARVLSVEAPTALTERLYSESEYQDAGGMSAAPLQFHIRSTPNSVASSRNVQAQGSLGQSGRMETRRIADIRDSNAQSSIPHIHRSFLCFLMEQTLLLESIQVWDATAISTIRDAFLRQGGLIAPNVHIEQILLQFKPVVGSDALREECNNRKKDKAKLGKFRCPFPFCEGHCTRVVGLQNHLSAHFRLTPQQCSNCSKFFSDTSFKRHVDNCQIKYCQTFRR